MLEHLPASIPKSLRLIAYASEPMPAQLITALLERMPNVQFVQFYGMIEHLCLTVMRPSEQLTKMGTVGHPMIGAELKILDADSDTTGDDMNGEIIARTPTLFGGYSQDPSATSQVMQEG
ncbi:MAG: AMP-binding protein [Aestuariivirga sp.]|nr:AMP-binding protein [Aestuariivirga sp.]